MSNEYIWDKTFLFFFCERIYFTGTMIFLLELHNWPITIFQVTNVRLSSNVSFLIVPW